MAGKLDFLSTIEKAHEMGFSAIEFTDIICQDHEERIEIAKRLRDKADELGMEINAYAVHAHAKDFYLSGERLDGYGQTRGCNYFKGSIIGEGDIDVARCIAVLKKAGYDGYLSIEFEGDEDCIYGIRKGKEHLESII